MITMDMIGNVRRKRLREQLSQLDRKAHGPVAQYGQEVASGFQRCCAEVRTGEARRQAHGVRAGPASGSHNRQPSPQAGTAQRSCLVCRDTAPGATTAATEPPPTTSGARTRQWCLDIGGAGPCTSTLIVHSSDLLHTHSATVSRRCRRTSLPCRWGGPQRAGAQRAPPAPAPRYP